MIIKTEQDTKYIVKFRSLFKYYNKRTADNYGRIHYLAWKEPIISCTIKEYKRNITDSFSTWTGSSWCRYNDNFDEKKGVEIALDKALDIAIISEADKKTIRDEVLSHIKIKDETIEPYMKKINVKQFLEEIGLA